MYLHIHSLCVNICPPVVILVVYARQGMYVCVYTHPLSHTHTHTLSLVHTCTRVQLAVVVSSYVRSEECMLKHGVNLTAALKPDGSALLLAVRRLP